MDTYTTCWRSLESPLSFYNSQTEHNMETKSASIDFSRRGAEGFRSSRLQVLGNQLIYRPPYIKQTNRNCYLL